jgi:hypothetical protein
MEIKSGHHTCVGFKNVDNLNIGDKCFVKINGRIFGNSYVEEINEKWNMIGVNLPNEAEEYVCNLRNEHNIDNIKYDLA